MLSNDVNSDSKRSAAADNVSQGLLKTLVSIFNRPEVLAIRKAYPALRRVGNSLAVPQRTENADD